MVLNNAHTHTDTYTDTQTDMDHMYILTVSHIFTNVIIILIIIKVDDVCN